MTSTPRRRRYGRGYRSASRCRATAVRTALHHQYPGVVLFGLLRGHRGAHLAGSLRGECGHQGGFPDQDVVGRGSWVEQFVVQGDDRSGCGS
ncbi:hypothetical protein [Amycolatopsis jejuensis]|uniref:hypothetical protein n=1 Tax=Amycolatopsis jejuensis TaxID=330084 RepID=UPI00068A37C0|nr:hypothetical protein [Amycolatopsis jejuensis]